MPMPRKPTNILEMTGALKKNPKRYQDRANEPKNLNAIRKPPAHLSKDEKAAYREIIKLSIPGVLGEADTLAVEMAACLLVKCRGQYVVDGKIVPAMATEQSQFFKYLNQFGMSPADRSKISVPKKTESSAWDEL